MSQDPFGLLELGSNSLKFYLVRPQASGGHTIQTHKSPWRVAHDYFSRGVLSDAAANEVVATIRSLEKVAGGLRLDSMLAVATGVFRELTEIGGLARKVKAEAGIRLRVITGEDEARLMARSFPKEVRPRPVLLCDLGGATTEWAIVEGGAIKDLGSLPLGAIRNEYKFRALRSEPDAYLSESAMACDRVLEPILAKPGTDVVATGGTAKALTASLAKSVVTSPELRELLLHVLRSGPPAHLKPERQAVLLPGLVILDRLVTRCRAATIEHTEVAVRDGLADRLVQLLGTFRREDLHSTLLLHTKGV